MCSYKAVENAKKPAQCSQSNWDRATLSPGHHGCMAVLTCAHTSPSSFGEVQQKQVKCACYYPCRQGWRGNLANACYLNLRTHNHAPASTHKPDTVLCTCHLAKQRQETHRPGRLDPSAPRANERTCLKNKMNRLAC